MLKLRIVQAEYGDCLILEYGTPEATRYTLIDGGPPTTYERHLRDELQGIRDGGGKLDLAILSHVDNDHIIGLLDLLAELRQQRANGSAETIAVDGLWHNTFSRTIGSGNNIEARLKVMMTSAATASQVMTIAGMAIQGIGEGNQLRLAAATLGTPVNAGVANDLVAQDTIPLSIKLDNLQLRVVGPTRQNLDELKTAWVTWLDKYEASISSGDPLLAAMADRSIPNLSSIMVLAQADGKTILLTGDGRGDHLLQGLAQAKLLNAKGKLHVDVFKVPHHGSDRNVTKTFFQTVTADQYVISANGQNDNPDLATLIWIAESARKRRKNIEIIVTNETPSTQKLVDEYPPAKYRYRLTVMKKGDHAMCLALAA